MTMASDPAGRRTAEPVAAQSPSLPVDPAPEFVDDATTAPLDATLPVVDRTVGSGTAKVSLSVPRAWVRSDLGPDEWTWRPVAQPKYAYVLRVEQVRGDRDPIPRVLAGRLLQWVPVPGTATAQVEVAISGRQVDVPGMQDLISRVAASVSME